MTEPKTAPVQGVAALIIGPDGHVWAAESDFEQEAPGGYTLAEAQERRAKHASINEFFLSTCHPAIAGAIEYYHKEQAMRDLRSKGWRVHVIKIGHDGGGDDR